MKKMLSACLIACSLILASCGGGGGGTNSSGTVYYTHAELAEIFVQRLWEDLGIDAELVKTNTLQYDYIVVYDHDLDSYDAYYIGNYNPGENLANYLNSYDLDFVYDLWNNFDGTYSGYDFYDNYVTFDRDQSKLSTTDSLKKAKFVEDLKIQKVAENMVADYGVNHSVALKVSKMTYSYNQEILKNGTGSITNADSEALYQAVLGIKPEQGMKALNAYRAGDATEFNNLIDVVGNNLELSSENTRALVLDFAGIQE